MNIWNEFTHFGNEQSPLYKLLTLKRKKNACSALASSIMYEMRLGFELTS